MRTNHCATCGHLASAHRWNGYYYDECTAEGCKCKCHRQGTGRPRIYETKADRLRAWRAKNHK